ncbi:MAG: ankyrin repeat domain-containing protein [Alphaproteobacteria bacterium]|nr:ankyrin repeat domain-containing protein [Alphaproteobacteria bacterium]
MPTRRSFLAAAVVAAAAAPLSRAQNFTNIAHIAEPRVPRFNGPEEAQGLYRAIWDGRLEDVRALAPGHPFLHADNEKALCFAVERGHAAIVRYLVEEQNADISTCNHRVLFRAMALPDPEIFDYLLEKSAPLSQNLKDELLTVACMGENFALVKRLVGLGADVNYYDGRSESPVTSAAKHGTAEMLRYLVLERHADFHARNEDALRAAATHKAPEQTAFLLEMGADPYALTKEEIAEIYQSDPAIY